MTRTPCACMQRQRGWDGWAVRLQVQQQNNNDLMKGPVARAAKRKAEGSQGGRLSNMSVLQAAFQAGSTPLHARPSPMLSLEAARPPAAPPSV